MDEIHTFGHFVKQFDISIYEAHILIYRPTLRAFILLLFMTEFVVVIELGLLIAALKFGSYILQHCNSIK